MPSYIVHHEGLFFEWSEICDAPTTCAMTRSEFENYWRQRHGFEGLRELQPRLERAAAIGCSALDAMTARECVAINRAAENGTRLSFAKVIGLVKRERPNFGLPSLPP